MPKLMVWVELSETTGLPVRIFKNEKIAVNKQRSWDRIACVLRSVAVTEIRRAIWERAKHTCEHCGRVVTWHVMQMHERLWRGRGGEISVANGACLCDTCHADDPIAGHGKRKVLWSK